MEVSTEYNYYTNSISLVMLLLASISGLTMKIDRWIALECDCCSVLERDCYVALERDCCIALECNCCLFCLI